VSERLRSIAGVDDLATTLGASWPAISAARARTVARRSELLALVEPMLTADTSFVVGGSVGRDEVTQGSDLDWTLLVDGQANPEHADTAHQIAALIRDAGYVGPGREATFGGIVFSHDLIHNIGGDNDDNANTTRRLLLLLESRPIGRRDAFDRTVRNVLSRYILEDFGWMHARNRKNLPRFLHNDFVRYWRTMAVDFAYKRKMRGGSGWALRTAKLRMSRKLIYVAGVLMCYACAIDPQISALAPAPDKPDSALPIVEFLTNFVDRTPLDIVAQTLGSFPEFDDALRTLFERYDEFLNVLDNETERNRLDQLGRDEVANDALYNRVRTMSDEFQLALLSMFFDTKTTPIYELTRTYGVF
jgi:hypothetical protein